MGFALIIQAATYTCRLCDVSVFEINLNVHFYKVYVLEVSVQTYNIQPYQRRRLSNVYPKSSLYSECRLHIL